jgi:hypothetical protein
MSRTLLPQAPVATTPKLTHVVGGALKPQQSQLLAAVQGGTLPPVAQQFMRLVYAGTQATGSAKSMPRVALSQVPPKLAAQLTALGSKAGVHAFAADLLTADHAAGKDMLTHLTKVGVFDAATAHTVRQALATGGAPGRMGLMQILSMLPIKVAQSILDAREAAMQAFFKAWSESLAENAALDAQAAKRNAEQRAQINRTNSRNAETAHNQAASEQVRLTVTRQGIKAALTPDEFGAFLLGQRQSVLGNAQRLAGLASVGPTIVGSASLVENSLNRTEAAGRASSRGFMSSEANVAALYALDAPLDDLGPRLGHKARL